MSRDDDAFWTLRKVVAMIMSVVLIVVLLGAVAESTKVIPAGYKGVVFNSPTGPANEEINEGWQFNFEYLLADVIYVEYRTQTINFVGNDQGSDHSGSISVSSKDNIMIYMDFSIMYHIQEDMVSDLVIENGQNYQARIIQPIARSIPRDIAAHYNAMDIRGSMRGEVERAISENITISLAKKYIVVEQFAMRDIRLPAQLETAIEQKKVAEQNVLTQQYNLQAEQYVANKSVVQMGAQAAAMLLNATAFANATVVRAEGQAQAIALVMKALQSPNINNTTRDYLTWIYIQALTDPNTRIEYIIVPADGGVPVLINTKP
jgi:regulator of protease activity HflC (stomatin/prohibitin superfamily)